MISIRTTVVGGFGLFAAVVLGAATPFGSDAFAGAPGPASGRKGAPSGPGCIYGQVVDGHSGDVRCLSPAEVAPPGPFDTPAERFDAGADGASTRDAAAASRRDAGLDAFLLVDASAAIPLKPPSVAIEDLTFESGDVPRAPNALERIKKDFARCAADAPASKAQGSIELRFLVRAPGRAEGVDVVQSRGMSADVVRCVASALAGRPVGAPTSDPVGVALTVRFRKD